MKQGKINTVGNDKGIIEACCLFHAFRFDNYRVNSLAKPAADMNDEVGFFIVGAILYLVSEQVATEKRGDDWRFPLYAPARRGTTGHNAHAQCQNVH